MQLRVVMSAVVVALLTMKAVASTSAAAAPAGHHDRFPALNALFNNSFIPFPSITINASKTLQLTLSQVYCGDLYIDGLTTNASSEHYALDLHDASLECQGRWDYILDGVSYHPGTFRASVEDVHLLLKADGSTDAKYHLPTNFRAVCDFGSKVHTSFKGEVVAWILDLLRPVADFALQAALRDGLCAAATPVVTHAINNLTNLATAVLGPFLDDPAAPVTPTPAPTPAPAPGSVVNWAAVPILSEVLAIVNKLGPDALNLLVAILTQETGEFNDLPLGNITLRSGNGSLGAIANSTLELQSLSIGGLDTITSFDVLDPDRQHDNCTVDSKLGFKKLTLVVRAELKIWRGRGLGPAPPEGSAQGSLAEASDAPVATQVLDLSFNLTNATLAVDLWAPLRTSDVDGLPSLLLGQLTDPMCWLSKMDGLQILLLAPSAFGIEGPAIKQVALPPVPVSDLWAGLEDVIEHIEGAYYPSLLSGTVLPRLFNVPVAEILNILLYSAHDSAADACAANTAALRPPGYVDWSNASQGLGSLLRLLDVAFNGVLKAVGVDALIEKLVPGGRINAPGTLLAEDVNRPDYGAAKVNLSNLTVTGLASLSDIVFPRAVNDSTLNLEAKFCESAGDTLLSTTVGNSARKQTRDPLSLGFNTLLHFDPPTSVAATETTSPSLSVTNEFSLTFRFGDMDLVSNITALVNRTRLARQRLLDVSLGNLTRLVNETTHAIVLSGLNLSTSDFAVDVRCGQCDTPALQKLGPALAEPAARVQLTKLFNVAFSSLGPGIEAGLNKGLQNFLQYNDTPAAAPAPWVPDFFVVMSMGLGLLFLVFVFLVTTNIFCKRRRRSDSSSMDHGGHHKLRYKAGSEHHEHGRGHRKHHPHSIICSVPIVGGVLFLGLLAFTYADYVTANNLCGTEIAIRILAFADTSKVQYISLYNFTLENSVAEMWDGGVYALALAIACFSGVWPYLKLLLMFFSWTAPTRVLSVGARYKMLFIMDALGKWSLLDAFVLVLMLNIFKLPISLEGILGFPVLEIDVVAAPRIGIYLFMVATVSALICNHIELNAHRHLQFPERYRLLHEAGKSSDTTISKRREALCGQAYRCRRDRAESSNGASPSSPGGLGSRATTTGTVLNETLLPGGGGVSPAEYSLGTPSSPRRRRQTLVCRFWVRYFITTVIVLCIVGLLWGSFVDTFSFDMKGLASVALGGANKSSTPYSLISVGNISSLIKPENSPAEVVGYYFLQAAFYLFALGVPVLYLIVLLVLWTVPMTLRTQHTVFVISETLAAWSAVDVFILSIIVALLELPQYVSFIVGDKCDAIDVITEQFPWVVPDGDTHCFDVTTSLKSGCWILVNATVMYLTVSYSLTRVCDRAIEERSRFYHHLLTSPRSIDDYESQDSERSSDSDEEEDLDDTDRPFVNCDGSCSACLFKCFRRICFVKRRRPARFLP
eukprot:INCI4584.1.p1 GENE.INCI4584.1~~INCI4584.1.p1  ORF type:complete len:1442 (-),score=215.53 INCI4584.1:1511-5836(-)